jgi:hypothetical protein
MDILSALAEINKSTTVVSYKNDFMKDAVWETCLYRLGFDSRYYRYIDPCDREDFLNRIEKQK